MSKNLNLDPVLLNINSINSSFSEKNVNLYGCYESQDSAIGNDFNDNLTIDVIPRLENYRRSLRNTFKQETNYKTLSSVIISDSYCCLKANVLEEFEMRRLSYICSKCLGIEEI